MLLLHELRPVALIILQSTFFQSFVEIKLTFMKINDIDTVAQLFEAEILVRAKWQEPLLVDKKHIKVF